MACFVVSLDNTSPLLSTTTSTPLDEHKPLHVVLIYSLLFVRDIVWLCCRLSIVDVVLDFDWCWCFVLYDRWCKNDDTTEERMYVNYLLRCIDCSDVVGSVEFRFIGRDRLIDDWWRWYSVIHHSSYFDDALFTRALTTIRNRRMDNLIRHLPI